MVHLLPPLLCYSILKKSFQRLAFTLPLKFCEDMVVRFKEKSLMNVSTNYYSSNLATGLLAANEGKAGGPNSVNITKYSWTPPKAANFRQTSADVGARWKQMSVYIEVSTGAYKTLRNVLGWALYPTFYFNFYLDLIIHIHFTQNSRGLFTIGLTAQMLHNWCSWKGSTLIELSLSLRMSLIMDSCTQLTQEVCKKEVLYTGSNFQAKVFRPLPPLLYAVWYSHNFYGKFPFPAIHF